ncbi:hypothetical protein IGL98_002255 [Enterococcus sp. DIV0840]|uniref:hypothetical protein n=1 Tax=Enterococcus TaxID=1350 RepID=UPI001A8F14E1|nr:MULTISPECIES: hypothetical protein [Enterococcus]MBO0433322.1 hypothetical protein [Enterococcus sp. DIV0849a]MBO0473483.1 hypothetical protein [Enterococcus ureasiticus]
MLKKKLLVAVVGLGLLFFGNTLQASAVAKGNPDDLKIDAKANEEAIKFVEEHGGLEDSPVSIENLTTQEPTEAIQANLRFRLTRHVPGTEKIYTANVYHYGREEIKCNYLVPTGFGWDDNGIPMHAVFNWGGHGSNRFGFGNVGDTGVGGYGTGG